ncbi:GCN5-related N-acetyltransferase [Paenibacillus curdlanolyticus YK9]|uniref:GCN5-related N-acetyltransferase n=1 Tax=Paenibacillus curdlanolyticus YK9 TaxID=717606 RepID=E0I8T5_9BACL|nr:GNAT family N-acetyltransferase [Paenibacillus curdlanolyticus]EFM10819.1 GCN5-related N-acetyltransferase [Paenibacillus curdlanolyticus YK9]
MGHDPTKSEIPAAWQFHIMSREQAQELCRWRYEAPFDLYGWSDWDRMLAESMEFGDDAIRVSQYVAAVDEHGRMIGFAQFFPLLGVTRLGLGLRPDLCGFGLGPAFARSAAEEARKRAPHDEIDLEVLAWNTRAIRAYAKAGFTVTDTYDRQTPTGPAEFHCMVYETDGSD